MKRTREYEVNHLNKTVVVTKKFLDEATQLDSDEAHLMDEFRQRKLRIIIQKRQHHKSDKKKDLLTYKLMKTYISALDDADDLLNEFKSICEVARGRNDRSQYVNDWFNVKCPDYNEVPKFDKEWRIIHGSKAS